MNFLVMPRYSVDGNYETRSYFAEMHELATASYRKNLLGDWKLITLLGDFSYIPSFMAAFSEMQRDQFKRLYSLWQQGHNVLFVDTDTICKKPTEFFGKYKSMVMPWITCGSCSRFEQYMNGGVMYFPATMKQETWDLGLPQLEHWKEWDDSQLTYNDMFWSQPEQVIDPKLNFSPFTPNPLWIADAHIVHFHGSKSYPGAIEHMKGLTAEL
jgi:hypothetical protein